MRYETRKEEIEKGENKIWLDDDEIELQINFIDKKDEVYILNTRAIIDGEAYNNFEVEVKLIEPSSDLSCVADILKLEWEWYDIIL